MPPAQYYRWPRQIPDCRASLAFARGVTWRPGYFGITVEKSSLDPLHTTERHTHSRLATRAPSVSLSPSRISSVTTVSFSLMLGTTLCDSRLRQSAHSGAADWPDPQG
jgi:hypothetical protein